VDSTLLQDEKITIPVQVNGKVRATVTVPATAISEEQIVQEATQNEQVKKWIEGKKYKVVYIKGRILNLIVQ
jgi:leucyl-tRNA synthetase